MVIHDNWMISGYHHGKTETSGNPQLPMVSRSFKHQKIPSCTMLHSGSGGERLERWKARRASAENRGRLSWRSNLYLPWRIHGAAILMVCHGSHQYTPFMLAYMAAPHGSYLYLGNSIHLLKVEDVEFFWFCRQHLWSSPWCRPGSIGYLPSVKLLHTWLGNQHFKFANPNVNSSPCWMILILDG